MDSLFISVFGLVATALSWHSVRAIKGSKTWFGIAFPCAAGWVVMVVAIWMGSINIRAGGGPIVMLLVIGACAWAIAILRSLERLAKGDQ